MTEPAATGWLLVLGSNRADAAARLEAARAALAALGSIERCSPPLDGADIGGRGPRYLNQLLRLRSALPEAALRAALKGIEQAQGRSAARLADGLCDLDIDLLARLDGERVAAWLADKPLRVPAVAAALRGWGLVAGD
jgi:2-amino-4-hydroxy-6-hydroxymethyldihydropteridine diphosphokinase